MNLTTMADPVDPVAAAAIRRRSSFMAEHVELRRIAAVRALELHARINHLDAKDLADAMFWASRPAICRELGSGSPV